jgi:hypothetical protein
MKVAGRRRERGAPCDTGQEMLKPRPIFEPNRTVSLPASPKAERGFALTFCVDPSRIKITVQALEL